MTRKIKKIVVPLTLVNEEGKQLLQSFISNKYPEIVNFFR
jgi:hypothetical protein